jgi:hypothetical protein
LTKPNFNDEAENLEDKMKKTSSTLLIVISLLASMLFGGGCSRGVNDQRRSSVNSAQPETANQGKTDAKLLVRERLTGVLAVDGLTFYIRCRDAETNDKGESTVLSSGDGLNVQSESHSEFKDPVTKKAASTPQAWAKDPKDFDFQLDWDKDLNEHAKTSTGEPLKIAVSESLKLTKVSDPKVTKTWTYTYDLQGPASLYEPNEGADQLALDQIKSRIRPVRDPLLKEIRSFIQSNK